MTTIKATCPDCGEVSLTPEQMELRVAATASSYAFSCPDCGDRITKPADERIVRLLVSGGVPVIDDEEEQSSRSRFPWPAFTYDDVLDFHTLLERSDWFELLLEEQRRNRVR